jgi:hypothetical protein
VAEDLSEGLGESPALAGPNRANRPDAGARGTGLPAARSVGEIEAQLGHLWAVDAAARAGDAQPQTDLTGTRAMAATRATAVAAPEPAASDERHVLARSSVLNLIVVAGRPETAERCAGVIAATAGHQPSRSLILSTDDPDGPAGLEAQVDALFLPAPSGPAQTVAETVRILARGETGRHLASIIVPLLVHDLRVALWWPDDPQLTSHRAERLLPLADQLIVDGMSWSGDGLDRLLALARVAAAGRPTVSDFALLRQARWREALASVYDLPDLRPHLRAVRSITIEFATSAGEPASSTNLVRPVYHVAWLASRLGMSVMSPLGHPRAGTRTATLRQRDHVVKVELRPVKSGLGPGSTVRIQIASSRRGSELEGIVSAGDRSVEVEVLEMGRQRIRRVFLAPRLNEVDLLERAIEDGPSDLLAAGTLAMAARIIGPEPPAA